MQELLSICIPTFQRPQHLERLLTSLQQQLDGIEEGLIKIYISDNCSGDNTPDVVRQFMDKIPSIYYNRNTENIGMMLNFVKLFEIPAGEIYGFLAMMTSLLFQKVLERSVRF